MRIHHSLGVQRALESLPRLTELGIGAELYLEPVALDGWTEAQWRTLAGQFADTSLSFHAPFWNLDPLSPDPAVAKLSKDRLEQTLWTVSHFTAHREDPVHIVLHSGIPHGRTGSQALERAERLIPFLEPLLREATQTNAAWCLENTHEPDPQSLARVLAALPDLRYCFDAAHAQVFSRTPQPEPWLALNPAHLHLNDNHGVFDDHLQLGQGMLPHRSWLPDWAERGPLVLEVRGDPAASLEWLNHALRHQSQEHEDLTHRAREALTVG
jgi:sugar phosphate isomerase/epimerase